ncbi:MAG TPA: ABC transporter substrate-binding protein [Chloroflexota bacterium]
MVALALCLSRRYASMAQWGICWAVLFGALACGAPARQAGSTGDGPTGRAGAPVAIKTLTIGALDGVKSYGSFEYPGGGLASLSEIGSNGLVTDGVAGGLEPRLATALPSFDDNTIKIFPDGRMQTTWKLRDNVLWHDGVPFTADDIVFSAEIGRDPIGQSGTTYRFIESVDAPDPHTAVINWKTTYFKPLELPLAELWPYPKHLLEESYRSGDTAAFQSLPYFTSAYVHLGPFRLIDWGMGEEQVFERFDRYFRGPPRVDRVIIRTIPDPNTLYANLKARAVDIAPEKTMPSDLSLSLRDEWQRSSGGVVRQRQENWRYLLVQLNSEWARPVEVAEDIRVRRGLYAAIDLEALRAFALPGVPDTNADSFMYQSDPRAPTVGKPFARYRHDPAMAMQELANAGWRSVDGRVINAAGEPVQLSLRGSPIDTKEVAVIAQYWRTLGLAVTEEVVPPARQQDREYRAKFASFEIQSREPGDHIVGNFDSRRRPTPDNSYVGSNPTSYINPAMDRLIDRLSGTLDEGQQALILKDMGETLAADLPVLPTYFRVQMAAVISGVRALDDYPGMTQPRALARNAYLWDRD